MSMSVFELLEEPEIVKAFNYCDRYLDEKAVD
jgi:hypothetical protein